MKKKKDTRKIKAKEEQLTCYRCRQRIDKEKDNYVNIASYNKGKLIEDVSFHLSCWRQFNQEKVNQRIMEMTNAGMGLLRQGGDCSLRWQIL
jgi:hypothetical protein